MRDEHQALRSSATRVRDMVVEGSDETFSLVVALSSIADQIEGYVDATTANGVL
jgi:hypothetical protein